MKKEIGICSICLKENILSDDHVPPKCCGNNNDSYYRRFTPEYLDGSSKMKLIHSQNGFKLRTICNKCNNDLGTIFDVHLMKFYKITLAQIKKQNTFYSFDLLKVIKAVIGHFLASAKPQDVPQDNDMRIFYNSNNDKDVEEFANKYSLFCLGYPYKDSIFILRDYITIFLHPNQKKIEGLISSMYFYPFAFILTHKQIFHYGCDLLTFFRANKTGRISISLYDWREIGGNMLGPTWPAIADDSHIFMTTHAAKQSAFKVNKL